MYVARGWNLTEHVPTTCSECGREFIHLFTCDALNVVRCITCAVATKDLTGHAIYLPNGKLSGISDRVYGCETEEELVDIEYQLELDLGV